MQIYLKGDKGQVLESGKNIPNSYFIIEKYTFRAVNIPAVTSQVSILILLWTTIELAVAGRERLQTVFRRLNCQSKYQIEITMI